MSRAESPSSGGAVVAAPAAVAGVPTAAPLETDEGASRILVAVRCRPLSDSERSSGAQDILRVMGTKLVILLDPGTAASNDYLRQDKSREKRYAFDLAFDNETGTQEVFAATTKPLIGAVLQAYNATVFAYGSTGAGKTFTMIGTSQVPGVMLRTVEALFERAAEAGSTAGSGGRSVAIRCSFVEVYNENLRDLLSADIREGCLDLREDPNKGMCVAGVTETEAESSAEVMDLLRRGNARRSTEPTAMNVTSSRSHAVLQVVVEQRDHETQDVLLGKLSLIDLAGSERAAQTENRGARLIEGANINRSLLALGNCINALASGSTFVPYRDSKLTRLLKDSLGGNCRTVMIANVSPVHHSYEDTLNTLKYANRAKNIRVSAQQNIVQPDTHVSQYEKAISDLRGEVSLLKAKLMEREAPAFTAPQGGDEVGLQEASEHWKVEVFKNLEGRTQLQRSLIEVDRGLSQWQIERNRAKNVIVKWDEAGGGLSSPSNRGAGGLSVRSQPRTLEEWQDQLSQIEDSIKENMETRTSIQKRLEENKVAGKQLQAQLPRRVLNEDLRAFLELIQRVQVLEVERLQLDHHREAQRTELETQDQEIAMLREQLRLRNEHLRAQRELLSAEQQQQLPNRVSLLGSTLAEASPVQQRGPLRIIHAWAPQPKEVDEVNSWDSRPLRQRSPRHAAAAAAAGETGAPVAEGAADEEGDRLPPVNGALGGGGGNDFDWRNIELPLASQIKGIARIQPPGSGPIVPRLAPKGWRQPPELVRADPQPNSPSQPVRPAPKVVAAAAHGGVPKPTSGGQAPMHHRNSGSPSYPAAAKRGSTCPPLHRGSSEHLPPSQQAAPTPQRRPHQGGGSFRRPSREEQTEFTAPSRRAGSRPEYGDRPARENAPPSRRMRARSEHSARMRAAGRVVLQPRSHDHGNAGVQITPGR